MIRFLFVAALLGLIAGCEDAPERLRPDQELRQKIFLACLKALPVGPQKTMYNDWAEVVDSCENAAYFQSLQIPKKVQP